MPSPVTIRSHSFYYNFTANQKQMKYSIIIMAFVFLFSCKNPEDEYHTPENALDAGREFIQQSLKGNFNTAGKYMLQDQDNKFWLDKLSKEFSNKSEHEKAQFSKASINIAEVSDVVPDSVTVISFSNSFTKVPQKVKVVKVNGVWVVDFKYTFSGNL